MTNRRLGRGLDGLLKGQAAQPIPDLAPATAPATSVPTAFLDPNPHQPRRPIKAPDVEQLAASIREHGVLQPIIVRTHGDRYQIIAGERRFRAAQALGLAEVPVVIRDVADDQLLELALVENLQREDLDPIEKAESFKAYLDSTGRTGPCRRRCARCSTWNMRPSPFARRDHVSPEPVAQVVLASARWPSHATAPDSARLATAWSNTEGYPEARRPVRPTGRPAPRTASKSVLTGLSPASPYTACWPQCTLRHSPEPARRSASRSEPGCVSRLR